MIKLSTRAALVSILATSLLLLGAGCGKSVEGETRTWNANKLELEKYAGKYPGLKTVITGHIAKVDKEFEAAKGIGDEDAKTKAMSLANQQLTQIITPFKKLDTTMIDIERLKKDPEILKMSAGLVNPAIQLADQAVVKAKALLDGVGVDTGGALVGKVEEAARIASQGAADLLNLRAKIDADVAAAKAEADKKAQAAKAAEAKPAEAKPAEAKPAEAKPAEAKPAEAKPAEAAPAPK